MTLYAIGDIHGHPDKLDRALELLEADGGAGAEVIFIGDYIDRGPDSRAVIQRLIDGLAEGQNWTCLKGNHDRMMECLWPVPAMIPTSSATTGCMNAWAALKHRPTGMVEEQERLNALQEREPMVPAHRRASRSPPTAAMSSATRASARA